MTSMLDEAAKSAPLVFLAFFAIHLVAGALWGLLIGRMAWLSWSPGYLVRTDLRNWVPLRDPRFYPEERRVVLERQYFWVLNLGFVILLGLHIWLFHDLVTQGWSGSGVIIYSVVLYVWLGWNSVMESILFERAPNA